MPTLHFLNVRNGDCSIIQHASGRVTVIDVCNASAPHDTGTASFGAFRAEDRAVSGNSQQKRYPANPIAYLVEHGVSSVFRYIQTHPDMDHLDGIEDFFRAFSPKNFWDTDNQEEKDLAVRGRSAFVAGRVQDAGRRVEGSVNEIEWQSVSDLQAGML